MAGACAVDAPDVTLVDFEKIPNPEVFLDIRIGAKKAGRMKFELFANDCPKTAENFRVMCTGEYGVGRFTKRPVQLKHTIFHRVIKGFMAQGGDFQNSDGTGGESIYGRTFEDENFKHKHMGPGCLSMANCGKDTNGSQFFITLKSTPHLNNKHVVFGRLLDGIETLKMIEAVKTGRADRPIDEVCVVNCGQLKTDSHSDLYAKNVMKKVAEDEEDAKPKKNADEIELESDEEDVEEAIKKLSKEEKEMKAKDTSKMSKRQRRLFQVRLLLNQSRKANRKEVKEEQGRMTGKSSDSARRRRDYLKRKAKWEDELRANGEDPAESFMFETAESVGYREQKKGAKQKAAYGWNVFNQDALVKAMEKRQAKVRRTENKESVSANDLVFSLNSHEPSESDKDFMVSELTETLARHAKFSRRRQHYAEKNIDSINHRNEVFNRKLARSYDKYTAEIKANLERGTAL